MRLFLLLSLLFPSLAFAGLVEVNSSQYLRESGNPQAQYLEVTLDNSGEIRVSNVNLQDGYIELASSTDVLLNGSSLMQPFSLPTGGSAVFPLEAGTHYLEVTLRGKPGGGLKVSFYEDKPDAPERGKGWELLDDGTVLNRATGLIFHRNINSPGAPYSYYPETWCCTIDESRTENGLTMDEYIAALNSGFFGSDPVDGNAGHSDWRAASLEELLSVMDLRVSPPFPDANGDIDPTSVDINGFFGGMKAGEPLIFCDDPDQDSPTPRPYCDGRKTYFPQALITDSFDTLCARGGSTRNCWIYINLYENSYGRFGYASDGSVWPVRGGTPE